MRTAAKRCDGIKAAAVVFLLSGFFLGFAGPLLVVSAVFAGAVAGPTVLAGLRRMKRTDPEMRRRAFSAAFLALTLSFSLAFALAATLPAEAAAASPRAGSHPAAAPSASVAVFGDSLADGLWDGLRAEGRDGPVAFVRLGTVSKGLTRPDWREWLESAAAKVRESGANRVVVLLGANDQQGLRDEDRKAHAFMTPSWDSIYAERAVEVVRAMLEAGADVEWVGLPVMRDASMDAGARHIDAVVSSAMGRLGVSWIRSSDLFRGQDGGYDPAPKGAVRLRADDGVHFTGTGYRQLAKAVWARAEGSADAPR